MAKRNTKISDKEKSSAVLSEEKASTKTSIISYLSFFWGSGLGFGGKFIIVSAIIIISLNILLSRLSYFSSTSSIDVDSWECEYTPPPEVWKSYNVLSEVKKDKPELFQKSYEDPKLLAELSDVFALSKIIKKVKSVSRQYPGIIKVELEYREPVAMVLVDVQSPDRGFLPVDSEGVRLPTGDYFTPADIGKYISIIGIKSFPITSTGNAWGDNKVESGAQIAAQLAPYKNEFGIISIIIHEGSDNVGFYNPTIFDICLNNQTLIRWTQIRYRDEGPEYEPGELSFQEKIAILRKRLSEKGEIKADSNKEFLQFSSDPDA